MIDPAQIFISCQPSELWDAASSQVIEMFINKNNCYSHLRIYLSAVFVTPILIITFYVYVVSSHGSHSISLAMIFVKIAFFCLTHPINVRDTTVRLLIAGCFAQ